MAAFRTAVRAARRLPSRPLDPPSQHRALFTRSAASPFYSFTFALKVTALAAAGTAGYYYLSDSRAGAHRWLVIPLVHALTRDDPEAAHRLGVQGLKWSGRAGFVRDRVEDGEELQVEVWGKRLSNPLGVAAGFDKHGEAVDGLFDIGFGYVEVGSVTPQPQPGNPTPRVFRLPSTESMVNRYGFNSDGHYAVLGRLRARVREFVHHHALSMPSSLFLSSSPAPAEAVSGSPQDSVNGLLSSDAGRDALITDGLGLPRSLRRGRLLGINLGKNKTSEPDSADDFVDGVERLGPYADVLVVNVSSPNTPGLRGLQRRSILEEVMGEVVRARDKLDGPIKPPVLLKIAPDLSPNELRDIGEAARACKVDGIIVSNTTVQRPPGSGKESALNETGGLSGPPLKPLALNALSTLYATTEGSVPLIGCGGIRTGADALEYARAGALLVQLYTALGYQGVGLPRQIKSELEAELKREGKTWKQVVGSMAKKASEVEGLTTREEEAENAFRNAVDEVKKEIEELAARIDRYNPSDDLIGDSASSGERLDSMLPSTADSSSVKAGTEKSRQGSAALPDAVAANGQTPTSHPPVVQAQSQDSAPATEGKAPSEEEIGLLAAWKKSRVTDGPRRV